MTGDWHPLLAQARYGQPEPGWLVALWHGVYEVVAVWPLERALWTDYEEDAWVDAGRPDPWSDTPFRVQFRWVGGVQDDVSRRSPDSLCTVTIHGQMRPLYLLGKLTWSAPRVMWEVYRNHRWPQCSCCGEPMPCQAELNDRRVAKAMAKLEVDSRKMPGCCWACTEPISHRQEAVVYAGDNLDLPGGPEVRFHIRRACRGAAERYEDRWREADPTRPRIITWPVCKGTLFTHQDGSQECFGGSDDCHGPATHDHRTLSSCLMQSHGCGRGCGPEGHPGALGPGAALRRPRQRAMDS